MLVREEAALGATGAAAEGINSVCTDSIVILQQDYHDQGQNRADVSPCNEDTNAKKMRQQQETSQDEQWGGRTIQIEQRSQEVVGSPHPQWLVRPGDQHEQQQEVQQCKIRQHQLQNQNKIILQQQHQQIETVSTSTTSVGEQISSETMATAVVDDVVPQTRQPPSFINNYCGNNPWMTMMMMMSQHQHQNNPAPTVAQPQHQNQMLYTYTPAIQQQQPQQQPAMDHKSIVNTPVMTSMNTTSMLDLNVTYLQQQQTNDNVNQSHETSSNRVDGSGQRYTTTMVNTQLLELDASVPIVPPQPTYVNGKQYLRIVKRREARAKMEELYKRPCKRSKNISSGSTNVLHLDGIRTDDDNYNSNSSCSGIHHGNTEMKPYRHESRHRHAMKRPRGKSGRFLTNDELAAYYKEHPEEDPAFVNNRDTIATTITT